MNLKRCPGCNRIIDVDDLKDIDPKSIIGCGLKEDDFDTCINCTGKDNSNTCKEMRSEIGWTKTTVKEYYEGKSL